jgi:hypothetical protein
MVDTDPGSPIIIVTGQPRSGTSLMMRMLAAGGLTVMTDGVRTPDQDNPFGYFELERVRSLATDSAWLSAARDQVVKVISPLVPLLPRELEYRVLFMRRDLDEVLASQARMLEHRGRSSPTADAQRLKAEVAAHLELIERLLASEPAFEALDVSYRELLHAPATPVHAIARFLGKQLDEAAMRACIEPGLYRNRLAPGKR